MTPSPPGLVGIGIDAVDLDRFAAVLRRRPSLATRLFGPEERAYTDTLRNPVPSLAARFAAKEAAMKALGVGIGAFDWADVQVRRAAGGRPGLVVGGRAGVLAVDQGVRSWQVSLTHTHRTASALVAALG